MFNQSQQKPYIFNLLKVKEAMMNRIPLKRFAEPKEVASAVAFLLSDESSYITGETLKVNGGLYM